MGRSRKSALATGSPYRWISRKNFSSIPFRISFYSHWWRMAIVHGTDGAEKICHIQVSARTEGAYLVLTVADDGCGITQEELADIRKEVANYEEDGKKYVALVNISARLHTLYKGHADFHIGQQFEWGHQDYFETPIGRGE